MQSKISTPLATVIVVIAIAIVGIVAWRYLGGSPVNKDAKGIPLAPIEAKPGADALHNIWQSGGNRPQPR